MANQLPQIKYIVQLMLENRSFDQMLGYLYTNANPPNRSPAGDPYDGLTGQEFNLDSSGNKVPVFPIGKTHTHPYLMPGCDPREGFQATNLQLFGVDPVPPGAKATNGGFVVNFENAIAYDQGRHEPDALPGTKPSDIMGMYDPSMLPVMSALARSYAVCDAWFSSAPTETYPNRAFALAGTSLGHLKDDFKILNTPSIFGRMSDAGLDWAAYGYNSYPYVRTDYPDTKAADQSKFGHFSDFQQRAKAGTLPAFTFLEPGWGPTGNSQHPVTDVSLGEKLIFDVYKALQTGAGWKNTLLIINYDEHGGNYDHVAPPTNATPPDNFRGDVDHLNFDFTRFGVRVPALLISPLIKAGTVFRARSGVIDHTSVLRTLQLRWPQIKPLGKRDAAAPGLGDVLTLAQPRTDDPLGSTTPPSSGEPVPNANRPSKLQKMQAAKVASLPVPNEHGTYDHDQPDLKTSNEAAEYIRDRTAAWADHSARRRRAHGGGGTAASAPSARQHRTGRSPSSSARKRKKQ
ncbi:MAG TPA: alkaline phosphatase family protein [Reyranella sp.]|nr:alkaline phosphatase family protein [Reyranella sp.]